jgi:hypothetical protein
VVVAPALARPTIDGVELARLRASLTVLQFVALATLLRSIAYDRWITVLASVLLLLGGAAAQRGRSWGVALAFGAAVAFPVAWAIGIAPPWFVLVGILGSLPYAVASRGFARFDKGATALLTLAAALAGAFGALLWKEVSWPLFMSFPALRPSMEAQHGLALLAVLASAALAMRFGQKTLGEDRHVRVAQQLRVAESSAEELEVASLDEEAEDESARGLGRRARR